MKRVLIIGAGLAGLSAAVYLRRSGYNVTVVEKRPFAGGRTYSFACSGFPVALDNGPHVMLGAYSQMQDLLHLVGAENEIWGTPRLQVDYVVRGGTRAALRAGNLPAPFHLLAGLLRFPLLAGADKFRFLRLSSALNRETETALDGKDARTWLESLGFGSSAMQVFWEPLILATLNGWPEEVSALQLARVLKLGFLAGRKESRILLFRNSLSRSLVHPIVSWLQRNGVRFELGTRVKALRIVRGRVLVWKREGTIEGVDAVVSAVPFQVLRDLLRPEDGELGRLKASLSSLETGSILNVHFLNRRRLFPGRFAALLGITPQWAFIRPAEGEVFLYSLVVSGAGHLLKQPRDELKKRMLQELRLVWADFSPVEGTKPRLVMEKHATLLCRPGAETCRPFPGRIAGNFFVAGDWTRTGLPPTMESAVRSGRMVAREIEKFFRRKKA